MSELNRVAADQHHNEDDDASIDEFHYRKRLREKLKQREALLLKTRMKQLSKQNEQQQQHEYQLLLDRNKSDRKRKRYSEKEWNMIHDYFEYSNMLDLSKQINSENVNNYCFDDFMDALNFMEIGMAPCYNSGLVDYIGAEELIVPWLNVEKVKRLYLKLKENENNTLTEKELYNIQLRVFGILLKGSPLENINIAQCIEKHSAKGLSMVECVFNLEEVKMEEFNDIFYLKSIIMETQTNSIIDLFLEKEHYTYDCSEDMLVDRAIYNIANSRLFYASCQCLYDSDEMIPETMNFDMLFKQLKEVDLDDLEEEGKSIDPLKDVLWGSLVNLKLEEWKQVINNGLVDLLHKLKFTYKDKIKVLELIFQQDFTLTLENPLFTECMQHVPDEDEEEGEDMWPNYQSSCVEMIALFREMIKNTQDISLVLKLFTKEYFDFIYDYFEDCEFYFPYNNPIELFRRTLSILKFQNDIEEIIEIKNNNLEILNWMKDKVEEHDIKSR